MSGMVAFIIINPHFVLGSAINYAAMANGASVAATAFPCISTIAPAVSSAGASCASASLISSAAAVASVLPIIAIGGTVAFSAALLSDAFRCRAEEKRRECFQNELRQIEAAVKIRTALCSAMESEKLPEMKDSTAKVRALEAELALLVKSVSENEDILATGGKLCRAREIVETVKKHESELAYLKYKKIDEAGFRTAAIVKMKNEIAAILSNITGKDPEAAEIIKAINGIRTPDISVQITNAVAGELIAMDKAIAETENLTRTIYLKALRIIKDRKLDGMLADKFGKALTIDDIASRGPAHIRTKREINVIDKINRLLSELVFLNENSEYSKALKKFDTIKNEEDREQRFMLYDDFVIFCEGLLKAERARIRLANDLGEMKMQLECLGTPKAAAMAKKINALTASSEPIDMNAVKCGIAAAIEEDSALLNSGIYIKTLKNAFEELGYETEADFETILINEKKLYIHKPSMKNYHVQLLSNPEKNMLQIEVVRMVESDKHEEDASRSQDIRDKEVQTEFCADYERAIRSLEEKGVAISEKNRKMPGEIKVKKVIDVSGAGKKAQRKNEPGLEKKIRPVKRPL